MKYVVMPSSLRFQQGTSLDPFISTQELLVLPKLLHFACDLLKALAQR